MMRIDFNAPDGSVQHECSAIRDGDWIIYRCAKCHNYERRYNWRTGEMRTKGQSAFVRHRGVYHMKEYQEAFQNQN